MVVRDTITMDLLINHRLQRKEGKIRFRVFKPGGRRHYKIRLWLSGSDLVNVDSVTYHLHTTFIIPNRDGTGKEFEIQFWTWGMFKIKATVTLASGKRTTLDHDLIYKIPMDIGMNFYRE